MTLSYWNTQFQFTKLLPDFQACLAHMQTRSGQVRDDLSLTRHTYGPHARQWYEVSGHPGASTLLPVFIHGGYWRALEAERHRFVLPALKGLTGAVANLEYRLMPEVRLADIIEDACAGLQQLARQTSCRIVPIGHSAGGHLAVTCARLMPDVVAGAVAVSGLFDLRPLQWSFLREEIGLNLEDIEGHSPQDLWLGHDASQVIVAVGSNETNEFQRQAHMFSSSHGARLLSVPNAHHMTVLNDFENARGTLIPAITQLLQEIEQ